MTCTELEKPLPHASLELPVAYMHTDTAGLVMYRCGKCLQFVRVRAGTVEHALPAFREHQTSKKCQLAFDQGVWRLAALLPQSETPSSQSSRCPGVPLVWPGPDFFNTYPWHQHDPHSRVKMVWLLPFYNESSGTLHIRSQKCDSISNSEGSACRSCGALQDLVFQKHNAVVQMPASQANHTHRSRTHLEALLTGQRADNDALRLQLATATDGQHRAQKKLQFFEQIFALLARQHVQRLLQLLQTWMRSQESIETLLQRIGAAINGTYRVKGRFSPRDFSLGLLVLRLGGYRLLHALNVEFGLPSLRSLRRSHTPVKVQPSIGAPDYNDVMANLSTIVLEPRRDKPVQRVGCQIALDETALRPSACYVPHLRSLGGLCPCGGLRTSELCIDSNAALDAIQSKMSPSNGEPAKLHYASQATVVALNFLGRNDYRSLPFLVNGCCGTKDARAFVNLMKLIIQSYSDSGAAARFGWFFSFATDGNAARRKGGFHYLLGHKLETSTELGKQLTGLLGMNYMVGPHDITLDFDWKHIIKREHWYH
jgi:hypothetical protein